MKSDELLQSALETMGFPVKQYMYRGTEPVYIVWNEADERGAFYADDVPAEISMTYQVHFFAPESYDYRAAKRRLREILLRAGFACGATVTMYERDTKTVHLCITVNLFEDVITEG